MLDAAIIAARLFQFASTMILFGSSFFLIYIHLPVREAQSWPRRLLFAASVTALVSGFVWLDLEAIALSGEPRNATDASFLWAILSDTQFGRFFFLRLVASLVSIAVFALGTRLRPPLFLWLQAILGALMVASFAWTGHGATDEGAAGVLHAGADVLHLLAAGIWIGTLVPMSILLARRGEDDADALEAEQALTRFSGVGAAVVAALVLSGLVNSWFLVGPSHLGGLLTNAYGVVLAVKLCLFMGMLGFAAVNRYRLTPHLKAALETPDRTANAIAALKGSVLRETALGFLVLLAVAVLGTLVPPISGG